MTVLGYAVWWLPAALWAAVYSSDMTLTLVGYKLYRKLEGRFFQFSTYELNPFWKTTVERGRWLTPRFGGMLLLSTAAVAALGWVSGGSGEQGGPALELALGGLFLTQAAVHLRHVRNISLFRALARGDSGVEGLLRYPAGFIYRMSVIDFATLAVLYGLAFLVAGSWFWLGGAGATLWLSLRHREHATASEAKSEPAVH